MERDRWPTLFLQNVGHLSHILRLCWCLSGVLVDKSMEWATQTAIEAEIVTDDLRNRPGQPGFGQKCVTDDLVKP